MKIIMSGLIGLCLLSAAPAAAQFYRWVDGEGKENYTNELSKVPEEYRGKAVLIEPDEGRVSVGSKASLPAKVSKSETDHRDKYGRGENYWRKRADSLRRELADLQDEYDIVLRQEREQDEQLKAEGKKPKKASTGKKKLQLEKKIAKVKRRLEVELPDEARRADAYPGWIRE